MKDTARQLFTNLAPAIACLCVCACGHIGGSPRADQPVLLLPKLSSLDAARISMLATQKLRYTSALRDYRSALSHVTPRERTALRQTVLCASKEYGIVAQETADSAFQASGLPRELPRP